MSKKMYSLKRFFRSFFPMATEPLFLLFENKKTGSLDIVVRSGDIIFSVPPIQGRDFIYQIELAQLIIKSLRESDFEEKCDLCCFSQCLKYLIDGCYYSMDDDFWQIVHPYNPDAFL